MILKLIKEINSNVDEAYDFYSSVKKVVDSENFIESTVNSYAGDIDKAIKEYINNILDIATSGDGVFRNERLASPTQAILSKYGLKGLTDFAKEEIKKVLCQIVRIASDDALRSDGSIGSRYGSSKIMRWINNDPNVSYADIHSKRCNPLVQEFVSEFISKPYTNPDSGHLFYNTCDANSLMMFRTEKYSNGANNPFRELILKVYDDTWNKFKDQQQKDLDQFKEDRDYGVDAIKNSLKKSGVNMTAEEVVEWLRKYATRIDVKIPNKPHISGKNDTYEQAQVRYENLLNNIEDMKSIYPNLHEHRTNQEFQSWTLYIKKEAMDPENYNPELDKWKILKPIELGQPWELRPVIINNGTWQVTGTPIVKDLVNHFDFGNFLS